MTTPDRPSDGYFDADHWRIPPIDRIEEISSQVLAYNAVRCAMDIFAGKAPDYPYSRDLEEQFGLPQITRSHADFKRIRTLYPGKKALGILAPHAPNGSLYVEHHTLLSAGEYGIYVYNVDLFDADGGSQQSLYGGTSIGGPIERDRLIKLHSKIVHLPLSRPLEDYDNQPLHQREAVHFIHPDLQD